MFQQTGRNPAVAANRWRCTTQRPCQPSSDAKATFYSPSLLDRLPVPCRHCRCPDLAVEPGCYRAGPSDRHRARCQRAGLVHRGAHSRCSRVQERSQPRSQLGRGHRHDHDPQQRRTRAGKPRGGRQRRCLLDVSFGRRGAASFGERHRPVCDDAVESLRYQCHQQRRGSGDLAADPRDAGQPGGG